MRHGIARCCSAPRPTPAAANPPRRRAAGALLGALALAALALAGPAATPANALDVPPNFVVENAVPGVFFDIPVCIRFLPDGRLLTLEKRGRLWVSKNGVRHPVPMWNGETEVLNNADRGALGVAVDPNFASNRYIYLLYTVDPDTNGVDDNDDAFGRLVRYQVSATDSNALDLSTRTVLIGTNWTEGILIASSTHTIGTVEFGRDGSLLVSAGEGAQFNSADGGGQDPNAFGPGKTDPSENIGAFRAQSLGSLAGKILRINPANGHGYPSNPYWDGNPLSKRSRIWAYGLRNPYRTMLRPGTGSTNPADGNPGTLYIGDVGWANFEELNILKTPGVNFGWPCYEGLQTRHEYQALSPPSSGCPTIGSPSNPGTLTWPTAFWSHGDSSASQPPGAIGRTSIAGAFYTGTQYPPAYRNKYFHVEFTFGWIRVLSMDANDQLTAVQPFGEFMGGPVDMEADPVSGDIFYVSIYAGEVRRIRYTGPVVGNQPPVAAASAAPVAGIEDLTVTFSSAGSTDPDGDPLAYAWSFGDGQGSSQPNPSHTYLSPGTYVAVLSVSDTSGALDTASVVVEVSEDFGFPTTIVLDDFDRADGAPGAPWAADGGAVAIADSALARGASDGGLVWDGATFGADQEAHVVLGALGAAGTHVLRLKLQGTGPSAAHVEVRHDAAAQSVSVRTYEPGTGWVSRGGPWAAPFAAGERLGARARANGLVEVFRGAARVGTASLAGWPFASAGGRIGLALEGTTVSRLDDFGGGGAVLAFNTPPSVTILSPVDGTFFAHDDTLHLQAVATDAQQPSSALAWRWDVDLHHNVHVHPSIAVIEDSTGILVTENHDDGSGTWYVIRLTVTDGGGLTDTASVAVFPDVDLSPGFPWSDQPAIGTSDSTTFHFWMRNYGPMPAPASRWRLSADDAVTLAEGDVIVPGEDSVLVTFKAPPLLAAGTHVLRITADTLGSVPEPAEGNNGASGTVTVVEGGGTTGVAAGVTALRLSGAFPNPARGLVAWTLELPAAANVEWSVHDVAGREVWREEGAVRPAGRIALRWDGRDASGRPAAAGVYLARVRAGEAAFTRRFALLR